MEHANEPRSTPAEPLPRRRNLFRWLSYGLGGAASAVVGLPLAGFLLGAKRPQIFWVDLGSVEEFVAGETRLVTFDNPIRQPWDGMTARSGVYVRREDSGDRSNGDFSVFAVNCAHLGCPVEWFPQSGLFMCPCHGGVYHANGDRASGPPPRGLFQCVWRERNGKLEVRAPHYPTLQDTEIAPA